MHDRTSCLHRAIAALTAYAKEQGCYKVILDCADDNAAFYSKCGFKQKEVQMVSGSQLPVMFMMSSVPDCIWS